MAKSNPSNEDLLHRFRLLLGGYIISTASTESLFLALLKLALRDPTDATGAIWLQFNSTRARLELVRNTYRSCFPTGEQAEQVATFVKEFRGLTRQRNFYCHAIYVADETGMCRIIGYDIVDSSEVIRGKERLLTGALCNEIDHLTSELDKLNRNLWQFIHAEQERLLSVGILPKRLVTIPKSRLSG